MVVLRLSVVPRGQAGQLGCWPRRVSPSGLQWTGRRAELLGVNLGFPRSAAAPSFQTCFVCVHMYILYACVIYVYVCMCADMYIYIYMCMCVCICICMRLYTCVCVCVCVFVHRL